MLALNDRKRGKTSLFAVARGNSATLSRKELRSARMTRLFTIHINRVDRCGSGGEKSDPGYTRGGPLHLACNAYVVTAMCHSRRANAARAKARVMNIYPRLLQNKCQYRGTRGERATKRNEKSRNPGPRFSPEHSLGVSRLRSYDIDERIKISSDPPATAVYDDDRCCWTRAFAWKLGYLFSSPENARAFARPRESSPAFIHFRFRMKNLAATITARMKFDCPRQ